MTNSVDPLELRGHRAYWCGARVDLTLNELAIVRFMAKSGTDITYRQIYAVVRGEEFVAGFDGAGYRQNARNFITRIRRKFRDLDQAFDRIVNYPGFGYRWKVG